MKSQGFYPKFNLGLCALKAGWAESIPEDDRPAMLGWVVEPDGTVHPGPFTITDCIAFVMAFMDGADGYEYAA